MNQSIHQSGSPSIAILSVNPAISQSSNWSVRQSISQSSNQSFQQSIQQLVNLAVHQSIQQANQQSVSPSGNPAVNPAGRQSIQQYSSLSEKKSSRVDGECAKGRKEIVFNAVSAMAVISRWWTFRKRSKLRLSICLLMCHVCVENSHLSGDWLTSK